MSDDPARPEIRIGGEPVDAAPSEAPVAPRPPRPPMSTRTKRLFAAGVAVAVLAVAVPFAVLGGDDEKDPDPGPTAEATPDTAVGEAFRQQVSTRFAPIGGVLNIYLVRELAGWRTGASTTANARTALTSVLPAVERVRQSLDDLEPFDDAPNALVDFRAAGSLYLASVQVGTIATGLPDDPLQKQLRNQAVRLQSLGERVYDQGGRDLAPFLRQPRQIDAVVVQPPAEIPDFSNSGVLAAAPLVPAPRAEVPLESPEGADQQSVTAWVEAVKALGIPSADALETAINGLDGPALGALANQLSAKALAVRALPDPASGRSDSARVQLGLFLQAEAARAAEAAALLTPGAARDGLVTQAQTLAVLGDRLWDPRLGERRTGFPADLPDRD